MTKRRAGRLQKKRKETGVLFSGGLDSAALIGALLTDGYWVRPVFIRCGLRWEKQELHWAKKFLRSIKTHQLDKLATVHLSLDEAYRKNWSQTGRIPGPTSHDREVFLPARNLLLTTKALLFLSSKKIFRVALATLKGNPFSDAKKYYFKNLEWLLSQSFHQPIRILTPFRDRSKPEVIRKQKSWPLHLSFSCINPQGVLHCGRCNKCAERQRAFALAGVCDRTTYFSH